MTMVCSSGTQQLYIDVLAVRDAPGLLTPVEVLMFTVKGAEGPATPAVRPAAPVTPPDRVGGAEDLATSSVDPRF